MCFDRRRPKESQVKSRQFVAAIPLGKVYTEWYIMEPFSLLFASFLLATGAGLVVAEGGPSTFGYDASSACSQRIARAHVEKLPCDFSRENWCAIAGNAYPWQAVRRFVQENQGLMKRMYGEEKEISVLKSEFGKHDVELELENEHNHLYSDESNSLFSRYPLDMEYDLEQTISHRRGRDYSSISSTKQLDQDSEKSTKESSSSTTTTTSSPSSSSSATTPHRTKMSPVPPFTQSTRKPTISSSTTPIVMLAQIAKIQNFSINEIPGQQQQIDRFDTNVEELTEISMKNKTQSSNSSDEDNDDLEDIYYSSIESESESSTSDKNEESTQFRPRPEYRPPDAVKPENSSVQTSMEGQLYQDVANKDKEEDSTVLKVRGINACPVKEEVVAPFWANNTRGEVLALLNVYPYEQYVHWEKCADEDKQMYCRDGCRCEQQHRLHRLLAYDPNNECRGIFSDWFSFPSCCICRCYDLPLEFRVTSRSPRTNGLQSKRKLRIRAPQSPPPMSPRRGDGFFFRKMEEDL